MKPKISLFTSLFKGKAHLKGFLEDIISQSFFRQSELIIINANSPEKEEEEEILSEYLSRHKNIYYSVLEEDPGVYAVWNLGVAKCRAEYISNANVDDRKHPHHLEKHYMMLEENPDVDLVYADVAVTYTPNQTVEKCTPSMIQKFPEYTFLNLIKYNMPHNNPVWRKSIHDKYGMFKEDMISAADFDMWLRAASNGSKFKGISEVLGLYYKSPDGISTKQSTLKEAIEEVNQLREKYIHKTDYRELFIK